MKFLVARVQRGAWRGTPPSADSKAQHWLIVATDKTNSFTPFAPGEPGDTEAGDMPWGTSKSHDKLADGQCAVWRPTCREGRIRKIPADLGHSALVVCAKLGME